MTYTCNHSPGEAEAGGLIVQGQLGLHSEKLSPKNPYIEIPSHSSHNGYHQEKRNKMLARMLGVRNPFTMEISVETPQKTKNRVTI
jgi:hypothetical protein